MKEIPLTQGYVALVDDEDFERVNAHKWCVQIDRSNSRPRIYAMGRIQRGGKAMQMHRFVLGHDGPVDHRDHDGLNNQRFNLRPTTKSQNAMNSRKAPGKSSRYKGVSWDAARGKWFACIRQNYKTRPLGRYREECDAAQAYNLAAEMMFGEFAHFNYPLEANA